MSISSYYRSLIGSKGTYIDLDIDALTVQDAVFVNINNIGKFGGVFTLSNVSGNTLKVSASLSGRKSVGNYVLSNNRMGSSFSYTFSSKFKIKIGVINRSYGALRRQSITTTSDTQGIGFLNGDVVLKQGSGWVTINQPIASGLIANVWQDIEIEIDDVTKIASTIVDGGAVQTYDYSGLGVSFAGKTTDYFFRQRVSSADEALRDADISDFSIERL